MVDDPNTLQEPIAATVAQAPKGGFLQSIIDIFVDPFKVFARIDAGLAWWKPFILVSIVAMIMKYVTLPLQQKLMELAMRNVGGEHAGQASQGAGVQAVVGLIMVPIGMIVLYLIFAGIAHLAINIMSSRSSFTKTLSLIMFCSLITLVEQIIVTVVLRMRGPEGIESFADMNFSLSLAPLLGEGKGLLNAVLQSLSIFSIWYYVVLVLGIAAIFKVSRKAAIIPALPLWMINVVVLWIFISLGARMG